MPNMKLFAWRVTAIHACVVLVVFTLTCMLNYLVWTYAPDSRFETLETLLLPFAKPVITLGTVSLAVSVALGRHTTRVMRKLAYFKN
jgi:hypothetical protein